MRETIKEEYVCVPIYLPIYLPTCLTTCYLVFIYKHTLHPCDDGNYKIPKFLLSNKYTFLNIIKQNKCNFYVLKLKHIIFNKTMYAHMKKLHGEIVKMHPCNYTNNCSKFYPILLTHDLNSSQENKLHVLSNESIELDTLPSLTSH